MRNLRGGQNLKKYILGTEKDLQIFSSTDFSSGIHLLSKTAVSWIFEHLAINISKVLQYTPIDPFPNTILVCVFCVHSKLSQIKAMHPQTLPHNPL